MYQKRHYLAGIICILMLGSCKKYLDIQPEDKYTEDQVFSNEATIKQALNGIYLDLAGNSLYGSDLSTNAIEVIARQYNVGTGHVYYVSMLADYPVKNTYGRYEAIWRNAYATIQKVNVFMKNLETARLQGVIAGHKALLLQGETLAIRAMLHFDLLRLYGPVYVTDSTLSAIPYQSVPGPETQPLLPASQVMEKVLSDLSAAASLLAEDPVISSGVVITSGTPDYYSGFRNRRLNYYAVKGLMARAYLYRRSYTAAYETAKAVLEEGEKWFPWLPYAAILSAGANPDRVFSPEVLLGLYNPSLYTTYTSYFAPTLLNYQMLTAQKDRLPLVFENNQNDYRYPAIWVLNASNIRTFTKFADVADAAMPWRFMQPLLRKSEMYYILAETEPDPNKAFNYLNTVRANRGLPPVGSGANLQQEITKEYQKEFWGEGQMFFYYKRQNMPSIPDGISATGVVNNPVYVVPLPYTETDLR